MRSVIVSQGAADYGARQEFLWAIQRHWKPAPLDALGLATPDVDAWILTFPGMRPGPTELGERFRVGFIMSRPWPFRWDGLTSDTSIQAGLAKTALERWKAPYPIHDTWIMDAALHSIAWLRLSLGQVSNLVEWAYSPEVRIYPEFHFETWHAETVVAEARRAQRQYYATIGRNLGERSGNAERDAGWLARWMAGEPDSSIASGLNDETIVRAARRRFARRAGITLADSLAARAGKEGQNGAIRSKGASR